MFFVQKERHFLIRFIAFSSAKLTGYYRFENRLQVLPVGDDDPQLEVSSGEHPFIVEYEIAKPDMTALRENSAIGVHEHSSQMPDEFLLSDYAGQAQREITGLLCLLIDPRITILRSISHCWVWDLENTDSRYSQVGYVIDLQARGENFSTPTCDQASKEPDDKHYNSLGRLVGTDLTLPVSLDRTLGAYFKLESSDRTAFLCALSLFHQSMLSRRISKSLAYLGLISTIEILIEREHAEAKRESCQECGQPRYQVRQKFLAFMKKYASQEEGFRAVADQMYKTRSGIGHTGKLLADDIIGSLPTPEDTTDSLFRGLEIQATARISMVNWLVRRGNTAAQ